MKLCFVSVHGPRETYFVDEPRIVLHALNHNDCDSSIRLNRLLNVECGTCILFGILHFMLPVKDI
jgi:hypothetical protein